MEEITWGRAVPEGPSGKRAGKAAAAAAKAAESAGIPPRAAREVARGRRRATTGTGVCSREWGCRGVGEGGGGGMC